MRVQNRHARAISRPAEEVFGALEGLGTPADRIWPVASMPFERTPGPLTVGVTRERHGIIRAVLDELDHGRKMVWRAELPFLKGTHGFDITETADGCRVEHLLDAEVAWWFAPVWVLKVRAIHDRIVERLLERLDSPSGTDARLLS